ncbi:MAG: anti-sigma factor family protein [Gemmatimonadales bacterium]
MDTMTDHLSNDELATYLDGALADEGRDRVERHLEVCPSCRDELAAVARLVDTAPPPRQAWRRGGRPLWVGVALAAGLAAVVLIRGGPEIGTGVSDSLRAPDFDGGRARLEVVAPHPDSAVPREGLTLSWRSSPATLYRVTVLTEGGEPVWSTETTDTVAMVPSGLALVVGASYFWRADGIANGIVTSTGARRLLIGR